MSTKKSRLLNWLLAGGVLLILAGVGFWLELNQSERVSAIQVKPESVVATLTVTGEVHAASNVAFGVPTTGRLTAVLVEEGDRIVPGQLLAQLDPAQVNAQFQQAQALAKQAQAAEREARQGTRPEQLQLWQSRQREAQQRLQQAQLALSEAKLRAAEAKRNANRFLQLRQDDLISEKEYDNVKLQADLAEQVVARFEADVRGSRQLLNQIDAQYQEAQAGRTAAQLAQSAAATQASHAFADATRFKQQDYQILSNLNGVITQRLQEPGNLVQPGEAVLTAIDPATLEILCDVEESDLRQLQVGQVAHVVLDALPDRLLPGRITRVGSQVNPENGTVTVRVRLQPQALAGLKTLQLLPGMTADVNIVTARLKQALVLPSTAILKGQGPQGASEASSSVLVFKGNHLQQQAVTIKPLSTTSVQVTSGLQAGEWVATVANVTLLDKKRVHPIQSP
ncbi:MAG: efflux RND transporter periplasmic adaptor subunit [Vampirovibrionales bacterium]|nr:efflux RND transporter periplasmic adaptor subunit [Vampirovibrionales bacterium]